MADFGIRFSDEIRGVVETPLGFCSSEITLGDYREICFSDCSRWNSKDYTRHWRISAKALLDDASPKLFCSSLEETNAVLWIGIPKGDIVLFYNRISKVRDLEIGGFTISPKKSLSEFIGRPSPRWSFWKVPLVDLKHSVDL